MTGEEQPTTPLSFAGDALEKQNDQPLLDEASSREDQQRAELLADGEDICDRETALLTTSADQSSIDEEFMNAETALSPADAAEAAPRETWTGPAGVAETREQEMQLSLASGEKIYEQTTQLLQASPSQPGFFADEPPLPPFSVFRKQGERAAVPSSQPDFSLDEPRLPPLSAFRKQGARAPVQLSQPGLSVEETPLPGFLASRKPGAQAPLASLLNSLPASLVEETPRLLEITWRKTRTLPGSWRPQHISRQKLSLWLGVVSGFVLVILVIVSILAQLGHVHSPATSAISPITSAGQHPKSRQSAHPAVTATSQQPVEPFPTTLRAQVAALEAHGRLFYNGNTNLPEIALTFDDGPSPAYTPEVLAILKRYNIKATFFDIGRLVKAYPELARLELQDGHIVGNHTWTHPDMPLLTGSEMRAQIQQTSDAIEQATGVRPVYVRPPYGDISARVLPVINSFGMTTVIWNDEARDWSLPGTNVIVARILNLAHDGAIILLHDGGGTRIQTVQALPIIIQRLRARGYRFVTMNEIVAHMHRDTSTPTPGAGGTSAPSPESTWGKPGALSPWREE